MLDDVLGADNPLKVNTVRLKNVKTGVVTEKAVDGVFIAIGHTPSSELFTGQLAMKPSGYIETNGSTSVQPVVTITRAATMTAHEPSMSANT